MVIQLCHMRLCWLEWMFPLLFRDIYIYRSIVCIYDLSICFLFIDINFLWYQCFHFINNVYIWIVFIAIFDSSVSIYDDIICILFMMSIMSVLFIGISIHWYLWYQYLHLFMMSIILFELHSLKVITALFAIIINNICIVFMSMFAVLHLH